MTNMFGFDDGVAGLFVVVEKNPLTPGCLTPAEIDHNIMRLKADLDRVGAIMKAQLPIRASEDIL